MDRPDSDLEHDLLHATGGVKWKTRTARPFDPPAVDQKTLALNNHLCRQRIPAALTFGDSVIAVTPIGLGGINDGVPAGTLIQFRFTIDARPLVLHMPETLYRQIIARIDPELLAADIDREILPLLLESCIEDSLSALEAALGGCMELFSVQQGAAFDLKGSDVALLVSINGQKAGIATLSASDDDLNQLADLLAARSKPSRRYGGLLVKLSFRAGALGLNLGELKTLKTGDVLLIEKGHPPFENLAATAGERWLFPIEMTRKGPTVNAAFRRADPNDQEAWMMAAPSQTDDNEEALKGLLKTRSQPDARRPQAKAPERSEETASTIEAQYQAPGSAPISEESAPADAVFDELPIKLVFELGRLDLPLGQLKEIGPGHVFELDRPLGEAVDIIAGGRRIGQGEIIRIEDQIGVRVARLFGQNEA